MKFYKLLYVISLLILLGGLTRMTTAQRRNNDQKRVAKRVVCKGGLGAVIGVAFGLIAAAVPISRYGTQL